jgi:hypothetical protein
MPSATATMTREQLWLTVAAALGAGALGGVFYAPRQARSWVRCRPE